MGGLALARLSKGPTLNLLGLTGMNSLSSSPPSQYIYKFQMINSSHLTKKLAKRGGLSRESKETRTKLKSSYEEAIAFTNNQFVEMVLVDAAFIIELLVKLSFRRFQSEEDYICIKPWRVRDLLSDLWMLENQLPLFILEDLLQTLF
ncbi:hypothetical protein L3X38_037573 [Prunus dulcis]|uniref:Uncharacterized protein n=1 Tax=Prunus dulcis TaxID=3755 RepID=A0AAD4V5J3_PRUDU|nr:hypothetical protein L3X38_037573 [Prunus dulcis]